MARVVLINSYNESKKNDNFSIGIFNLATVLKNSGHEVIIIDFDYLFTIEKLHKTQNIKYDMDNMANFIIENKPEIIGFYTMCNSYYFTIKLSQLLKQKNKKIKIMLGGPQATLTAKETLNICPWIDVIGIGEGEKTINNIVNLLYENKPFTDEKGVAYMSNGEVVINEMDLIENLDELPKIDYSFFEGAVPNDISLDVGRGCPFSCRYCSTKTFWKRKFRLKSSKAIIEDIIYAKKYFNINKFSFQHDLFTANNENLLEFCQLLKENGTTIQWACSSRIDTLNEDSIKKMSEVGCVRIFLGIETGSARMQKIINKNLKLKDVYNIVHLLKKYNIEITASLIYGFPEENENDIEDTLVMIHNLRTMGVKHTQLHRFTILPGTEYYNDLEDKLYYSNKFSDSSFTNYKDDEMMKYVTSHKSMFPQFLDFDINLRQQFEFLDTYIFSFSNTFMKYLSITYNLLIKKYGSHLKLFEVFKKYNEEKLYELESIRTNTVENPKLQINCFKVIIDSLEEGQYKKFIQDVFRFETDLVDFMYYNDEKVKIQTYKYDMYNLKQNDIYEGKQKEKTTRIQFSRIKSTTINIKKICV